MCEGVPLNVELATPTQEVVFRMLTPVFRYSVDGVNSFTHCGNHGNARFKIAMRPYNQNQSDWDEVTFADAGIRDMLLQREVHISKQFFGRASHFLVADVFHPESSVLPVGNTMESVTVHNAVCEALRLHSSAGLPCQNSYAFRWPPPVYSGLGIHLPCTPQYQFSHLDLPSVLRSSDFDVCRATIGTLLRKTWNDKITFDKVLRLAMDYHRLAFTLERVEHAFLTLMVAYEALFKRDGTENAAAPAKRIGRLLGAANKKDCMTIQKEFNDDPVSLSKIRNQIAHGDSNLNLATVASKYPSLYRHITAGIVALLCLPSTELDCTKDYYDEISRYTNDRFKGLPNS